MNIARIIRRRIRHSSDGVDLVGDVNAVVAANVGGSGSTQHVSSSQHVTAASAGRDDRPEPGRDEDEGRG